MPPALPDATLVLKLVLTPALIATATLVARRYGGALGGLVAGLPLTSGPVSVFLALERGTEFAVEAATHTIAALAAVYLFCVLFTRLAGRLGWAAGFTLGVAGFLGGAWAVSQLPSSLPLAFGIAAVALAATLYLIPRPSTSPPHGPAPAWDLPARMAIATGLVVLLTAAAPILGPSWTGAISPFPVFASVLAVFTHRHNGHEAATTLLRGVVVGSLGFLAFFSVVEAVLPRAGIPLTYTVAALAALLAGGTGYVGLTRPRPSPMTRPT